MHKMFSQEYKALHIQNDTVYQMQSVVVNGRLVINISKQPVWQMLDGLPVLVRPTRIFEQNWDMGGSYLNPEIVKESENF